MHYGCGGFIYLLKGGKRQYVQHDSSLHGFWPRIVYRNKLSIRHGQTIVSEDCVTKDKHKWHVTVMGKATEWLTWSQIYIFMVTFRLKKYVNISPGVNKAHLVSLISPSQCPKVNFSDSSHFMFHTSAGLWNIRVRDLLGSAEIQEQKQVSHMSQWCWYHSRSGLI